MSNTVAILELESDRQRSEDVTNSLSGTAGSIAFRDIAVSSPSIRSAMSSYTQSEGVDLSLRFSAD